MKEKAQRLVLDDDITKISNKRCVKNKSLDCDEGYFNTYSHFAIHHEMLTVIFLFINLLTRYLLYQILVINIYHRSNLGENKT